MRALAAVVIAACVTAPEPAPPPQIGPGIGTTHACETHNIQPPELSAPTPRPVPTDQAQRLLTAVAELDVPSNRPERMRIVEALRALADALDVVSPDRPNELLELRKTTDQIERGEPRTASEAELVQLALDAAAHALAAMQPGGAVDRPRLNEAIVDLAHATGALEPQRTLREQRTRVHGALRASVRAVFAATGAPEPALAQIRSPSG
jgi:hypothetical protein